MHYTERSKALNCGQKTKMLQNTDIASEYLWHMDGIPFQSYRVYISTVVCTCITCGHTDCGCDLCSPGEIPRGL